MTAPAPLALAVVPARSESKRAEDSTSLCVACRLCCDGTLFGFVPVTDEEADKLRRRLPITRDDAGEHTFSQCCVALEVGGCGIFPDRPVVCSSYECNLLRRVDAGLLDRDDGLEVVDRIRALVGRLDPILPPGASFWPRTRTFREAGAPAEEPGRAAFAAALHDLNALDHLLESEVDERLGGVSTD